MTTLEAMPDTDKAKETERRLYRLYNPQAIEFLYAVMTDDAQEMTERVEAAKSLACYATTLRDPDEPCEEDE